MIAEKIKPLTDVESIDALKTIFAAYELVLCLDKIQHTNLYKQSLKFKVNAALVELEKFIPILDPLFDKNEDISQALIQYKKELIQKIVELRPDDQSLLNAVLDEFFRAPELTAHRLGIAIKK